MSIVVTTKWCSKRSRSPYETNVYYDTGRYNVCVCLCIIYTIVYIAKGTKSYGDWSKKVILTIRNIP